MRFQASQSSKEKAVQRRGGGGGICELEPWLRTVTCPLTDLIHSSIPLAVLENGFVFLLLLPEVELTLPLRYCYSPDRRGMERPL